MEADYGVDSVLIEVVTHDDGLFGLAVTFYLENGKTAVATFEEGIPESGEEERMQLAKLHTLRRVRSIVCRVRSSILWNVAAYHTVVGGRWIGWWVIHGQFLGYHSRIHQGRKGLGLHR